MAENASLGGGEGVRVLGRTEHPLTVYDDLQLPACPRVVAVSGRQVGGAGLASPPFGVTACLHTVQNHDSVGAPAGEVRLARSVAQLRRRLALCRTDDGSTPTVSRPRRLRVRRPEGAGCGHLRPPGLWQRTGECRATRRRVVDRALSNHLARAGPDHRAEP